MIQNIYYQKGGICTLCWDTEPKQNWNIEGKILSPAIPYPMLEDVDGSVLPALLSAAYLSSCAGIFSL